MATQEQIEAVWDKYHVQRVEYDMSNECRLAAVIVRLEEQLHEPPTEFVRDLQKLINEKSLENQSNTPDTILAEFLSMALAAYTKSNENQRCLVRHHAGPWTAQVLGGGA